MIQDLVSQPWESPVAGSHPLARKGKEGGCETLTLEGGRIALGSLAMNTGGASCRPGRLPTGTIGGHKAAGLVRGMSQGRRTQLEVEVDRKRIRHLQMLWIMSQED